MASSVKSCMQLSWASGYEGRSAFGSLWDRGRSRILSPGDGGRSATLSRSALFPFRPLAHAFSFHPQSPFLRKWASWQQYLRSNTHLAPQDSCTRLFPLKMPFDLPSVDVQQLIKAPLLHDSWNILGAFVPVALAILLCNILKIGLGKDMQIAVLRSSIQLMSLGVALNFVFEGNWVLMSILAVCFMVLVAGHTAGERAKRLHRSHTVATLSLAVGAAGIPGLMILLKFFPMKPGYIIPTAGYVIGSSMNMVGGTLNRLHRDIRLHQGQIEASLALGASSQQAVQQHVQRVVAQGMGPMIDSIKTAGLISLPGSMTGMLMGGFSPLEAVQMQLQVLYMLLGGAVLSIVVSCFLGWHVLFTKSHQLCLRESGLS